MTSASRVPIPAEASLLFRLSLTVAAMASIQDKYNERAALERKSRSFSGSRFPRPKALASISAKAYSVSNGSALIKPAGKNRVGKAAAYLSELNKQSAAVLILTRAEVLLLIRAQMQRQGLPCQGTQLSEQDWELADQVAQIRELNAKLTTDQLAALRAFLGRDGEWGLVDLDATQRRVVGGALRRAAQALQDGGGSSLARLNYRRLAKIGAIATLALALLAGGLAIVVRHVQKPNLALHRPVKVSSMAGPMNFNGDKLVDGDTTSMGFHTNQEDKPYATIDLGESRPINRIIVHNRPDCCQERAVPLQIEVSDDGASYHVIAERREVFDKWIAKDLHAKGRFVRLQLNTSGIFHLAEVEVY